MENQTEGMAYIKRVNADEHNAKMKKLSKEFQLKVLDIFEDFVQKSKTEEHGVTPLPFVLELVTVASMGARHINRMSGNLKDIPECAAYLEILNFIENYCTSVEDIMSKHHRQDQLVAKMMGDSPKN